ncbi:MAG: hypothetical protein AcusKO_50880 [Acuticoccus sp.]
MIRPDTPIVLSDLHRQAADLLKTGEWQPFRPGVTAIWLYDEGDGGAAGVFLRYQPGARVALHEHVGYEHLYVLEGDQYDENGSYPAGSFVVSGPGTRHSPGSRTGCLALLIYEKAVRFLKEP